MERKKEHFKGGECHVQKPCGSTENGESKMQNEVFVLGSWGTECGYVCIEMRIIYWYRRGVQWAADVCGGQTTKDLWTD